MTNKTLDQLTALVSPVSTDLFFVLRPATGVGQSISYTALSAAITASLGGSYLQVANNLADVANIPTARTNLGLGTIATQNANAIAVTGGSIGNDVAFAGPVDFVNRVTNGSMLFDQRNTTSAVAVTSTLTPTIDRWKVQKGAGGTATAQLSSGGPPPFANCYLWQTGTGVSPGAADRCIMEHDIEGNFIFDAQLGTISATPLTLSFLAFASITGTYGGSIQNSAKTRSYPFIFSLPAVGWTYITITIPGDVTGAWLTGTNIGLRLIVDMGSGSNYEGVAAAWTAADKTRTSACVKTSNTNGATFALTGVQLELRAAASAFQHRPYDIESRMCQRYFWKASNTPMGITFASNFSGGVIRFPATMRATPTLTTASFAVGAGATGTPSTLSGGLDQYLVYNPSSSWNVGTNVQLTAGFDAEL